MPKIKILELRKEDVSKLAADNKFNRLRPTSCESCGQTEAFARRIFQITGATKREEESDQVCNLLGQHFRYNKGIQSVFLKSIGTNTTLIQRSV